MALTEGGPHLTTHLRLCFFCVISQLLRSVHSVTVVFIGSARSSLGLDSSQVRQPWASRFGYSGGGDKNVSRFRSQNQCWRILPRTSKFLSSRSKCCYSSVPLHWGRRGWWCPTAWTIEQSNIAQKLLKNQAKQAVGGEVAKENWKRSPIITGWKTSQGDTQRGIKAGKIVIEFCQNFVFYHIFPTNSSNCFFQLHMKIYFNHALYFSWIAY